MWIVGLSLVTPFTQQGTNKLLFIGNYNEQFQGKIFFKVFMFNFFNVEVTAGWPKLSLNIIRPRRANFVSSSC